MAFEMKYDRDGNPLPQKQEQIQQQPEPIQVAQPVQEMVQEVQEPIEQQEPVSAEGYAEAQQVQDVQQTEQQMNFRRLKEAKEKAEREREEAIKFAMDLRARYEQPQKQQQDQQPDEDDIAIGAEDLAEGKHLRAMNNKYKALKQDFNAYKQQTTEQQQQALKAAMEAKIKAQYPDFEKVVSPENIEKLKADFPAIANTLNSATNYEDLATSAYTLMHRLGIYKEDNFVAEKARAQMNAAKPKPMNSINPQKGDSALAHANAFAGGLTEQLKAQLLKEMNEVRRSS